MTAYRGTETQWVWCGVQAPSGETETATASSIDASSGPPFGCSGRVVLTLSEEPQRVGVCFDTTVPGGWNLGELCEAGRGYVCSSADLKHEVVNKRSGQENMIIDTFFDIAQQTASKKPLIIHIKAISISLFVTQFMLMCWTGCRVECFGQGGSLWTV